METATGGIGYGLRIWLASWDLGCLDLVLAVLRKDMSTFLKKRLASPNIIPATSCNYLLDIM